MHPPRHTQIPTAEPREIQKTGQHMKPPRSPMKEVPQRERGLTQYPDPASKFMQPQEEYLHPHNAEVNFFSVYKFLPVYK
jgi:hypothetical protein